MSLTDKPYKRVRALSMEDSWGPQAVELARKEPNIPATWGADIEVPDIILNPPPGSKDRMRSPGAKMSTHEPHEE